MVNEMDTESPEQEGKESRTPVSFPHVNMSYEFEELNKCVEGIPAIMTELMAEHKISARYKEKYERSLRQELEKVSKKLEDLVRRCSLSRILGKEIAEVVTIRGIESSEDWEEYVETTERDGNILAQLCDELNVNPLQVVSTVKGLKSVATGHPSRIVDQNNSRGTTQNIGDIETDNPADVLFQRRTRAGPLTGVRSGHNWSSYAIPSEREQLSAVLEDLARKANPDSSAEARSLENAHILLENLHGWPEHVQLVSVLHRTNPEKAYEEVKQLALSIEQSRSMFGEKQLRGKGKLSESMSWNPWKARQGFYTQRRREANSSKVADDEPRRNDPKRTERPTGNEAMRKSSNCGGFCRRWKEGKVDLPYNTTPRRRGLLGMNALQKLGIRVSILTDEEEYSKDGQSENRKKNQEAKVAKRIYVPPHSYAMMEVDCKEPGPDERVLWANRRELASGIFKISDKRATVPIHNSRDTAILFKEGEEVGEWSTEKWQEKWNDLNPLMLRTHETVTKEQRREQLMQQLEESMETSSLDEEVNWNRLADLMEEWKTSKAWVIVWPQNAELKGDIAEKLMKTAKNYLDEGGSIATAWPPITANNQSKWMNTSEVWKNLDEALLKLSSKENVYCTASNKLLDGKLYIEIGAPEGSAQFFHNYVGTALPKHVYEAVRNRAVGAMLPKMERPTSGTMSTRGGGVSEDGPWARKRRAV
ncbi:hypothetical protein COOONC_09125 [Cooperia oncophora]